MVLDVRPRSAADLAVEEGRDGIVRDSASPLERRDVELLIEEMAFQICQEGLDFGARAASVPGNLSKRRSRG